MATRMQQRRGTASQWTTADPILNAGEMGFESDTNKFKIGDGINHWSDLTYFADVVTLGGSIDDYIPLTQKGVADGVATLNGDGKVPASQIPNMDELTQDAINTALVAGTGLDKTYNDGANTITLDIDSTVATKTYADDAVSTHSSDTTSVHGISDTAELATKTFAAELLTNATKTNITITGDKTGLTITAENGVADSTTDNLTEGSTNKYFTDERAQDAVGNAVGSGLSYDDASGAISVNTTTIQARVADVSDTEIGYLNGVTSAIQTQIDSKAATAGATFTGAVSVTDATESTSTTSGSLKTAGGLGVVKDAYIGGDLTISGDFTVNGTTTTVSTQDLVVQDPLIYIAESNSANSVDLGIIGSFDDGTYQHSGLVRDASDGKWKLFKGVTDEPTTTVNFGQGSLDKLAVGSFEAEGADIGDVSNTELQYLNGVTSAIQTQIDAKSPLASPTFTGTVTLPNGSALGTPTSVTLTNATGLPVSTGISGLGTGVATFLATPSSANLASMITDEIGTGNLLLSDLATSTQTASYTLVLADKAKVVEMNVGSANNLTVPTNASVAFPVGTQIHIVQIGSGQTTVVAPSGGTINTATTLKLRAQWSAATLIKRATDTWVLVGDLATS